MVGQRSVHPSDCRSTQTIVSSQIYIFAKLAVRQRCIMQSKVDRDWETLRAADDTDRPRVDETLLNGILNGSTSSGRRVVRRSRRIEQQRTNPKLDDGSRGKTAAIPGSCSPTCRDIQDPDSRSAQLITITTPAAMSVEDIAISVLVGWLKNKNGAADGDVRIRKAAFRNLSEDLAEVVERYNGCENNGQHAPSAGEDKKTNDPTSCLEDLMTILMNELARTLFKGLGDASEACRESATNAVILLVDHVPDLTSHLAYLFPVVMARGVPAGSLYDPELQLFIHDTEDHAAYKRGKATERQDRQVPVVRQVVEKSEELRLGLCRLVGHMLAKLINRGAIGVLRPYLDDTVLFLATQFRDPYPAVKVEALTITAKLVLHPYLEQGMKFYAVGLARAIMPHLRHRHAKVRLAAIKALWTTVKIPDRAKVKGAGTAAIVDLVGFREDNVLPVAAFYGKGDTTVNYLAELTIDQSVSVREKSVAMVGDWLTTLPDRYDHQTRLLPYVLNAISDEAKAVSAIAFETLATCGVEYESEHQNDVIERRQFGVDGDVRANHSKSLPHPFKERPRIGARLYVRGNTRRFLLPLLVELSNWISRTRLQSAVLFRTLIVYCEEHLTVETHKLVPYLQRALDLACTEKDTHLEAIILECCELIGRFVVPESYLPHILSRVREEPDINVAGSRAALLEILGMLLKGALPKVLLLHIPEIVETVTARYEDIASEVAPIRSATVNVLVAVAGAMRMEGQQAVVETTYLGTGRLSCLERPVLSIVEYLLASGSFEDGRCTFDSCWNDLAAIDHGGDVEALVTHHAKKFVASAQEDFPIGPVWSRTCSPQLVLEGFMSICPQAPRTCPETLPHLVSLCSQIVKKIDNFLDAGREEVLLSLVSALVTRIATVWTRGDNDTWKARGECGQSDVFNFRSLIHSCLDDSWSKSPRLRSAKVDLLAALSASKAWGGFHPCHQHGALAMAKDIMQAIVDLLDYPDISAVDACKLLTAFSQMLHVARGQDVESPHCSGKLGPFSRQKNDDSRPEEHASYVNAAMIGYSSVSSRLDDADENVRLCALDALADCVPAVQQDEVVAERPALEVSGDKKDSDGEEDSVGSISAEDLNGTTCTKLHYSPFVSACIAHAITLTENTSFAAQLDTMIRRAACLDPPAFVATVLRFLDDPTLARPAAQMLSDLLDHGNILETLQQES